MNKLRDELAAWLDKQKITPGNIGIIRRALFVPWDSEWNGIVRDETAKREMRQPLSDSEKEILSENS